MRGYMIDTWHIIDIINVLVKLSIVEAISADEYADIYLAVDEHYSQE